MSLSEKELFEKIAFLEHNQKFRAALEKEFTFVGIISVFAEYGVHITEEDLEMVFTYSANSELDEEALDKVAGGSANEGVAGILYSILKDKIGNLKMN